MALTGDGPTVKIWHDDVRPAPDATWEWCKTNEEVQGIMLYADVDEISLDHDLGAKPEDGLFAAGASQNGSGLDLVKWMIKYIDPLPKRISIHSWNPVGALKMAYALNDAGHDVLYAPYVIPVALQED